MLVTKTLHMKTTKDRLRTHQTIIEILEAIQTFENLIMSKMDSINGFAGTFRELRIKYTHDIDIYERCIVRLNERIENLS